MSRFLFVTSPFVAHMNPMVSVAGELTARGHEVRWVAHSRMSHLLPENNRAYLNDDRELLDLIDRSIESGELALANAFKFFVEEVVVPLARSMRSTVETAIEDFEPDAMLVDHHALAGAIAARKAGIVWATSAPSAQLYTDIMDEMTRVNAWMHELYREVEAEAGVEPSDSPDLSPHLVLLYTSPALMGEREYPPQYRFVGALVERRMDESDFPWEKLRPGRKVLVSLGSIFADRGERFFGVLVEALKDEELQVIVSAPPEVFPEPPANFLVAEWVPQVALLPEMTALVTHGGSTVNESLAHAVPMVMAPITLDQFIYSRCVADAGAGIRVRFRRVGAAELRDAVRSVIEDPSYAKAARRIQASFAAAGGTRAASDALEDLLARSKESEQ